MSPIFEVGKQDEEDENSGILQTTLQQGLQAEALVICFSKALALRKEARRWFDTSNIVKAWMEV